MRCWAKYTALFVSRLDANICHPTIYTPSAILARVHCIIRRAIKLPPFLAEADIFNSDISDGDPEWYDMMPEEIYLAIQAWRIGFGATKRRCQKRLRYMDTSPFQETLLGHWPSAFGSNFGCLISSTRFWTFTRSWISSAFAILHAIGIGSFGYRKYHPKHLIYRARSLEKTQKSGNRLEAVRFYSIPPWNSTAINTQPSKPPRRCPCQQHRYWKYLYEARRDQIKLLYTSTKHWLMLQMIATSHSSVYLFQFLYAQHIAKCP